MRYNVLSNGFITTVASCDYGIPDYLFEAGVRIKNHDLPLWEAREIADSVIDLIYYPKMDDFIAKVLGDLVREPGTSYSRIMSKWTPDKYDTYYPIRKREVY